MTTHHHTGPLAETKHFPIINHLTMTIVRKCETHSIKEMLLAINICDKIQNIIHKHTPHEVLFCTLFSKVMVLLNFSYGKWSCIIKRKMGKKN
jgi:hypothetical protein